MRHLVVGIGHDLSNAESATTQWFMGKDESLSLSGLNLANEPTVRLFVERPSSSESESSSLGGNQEDDEQDTDADAMDLDSSIFEEVPQHIAGSMFFTKQESISGVHTNDITGWNISPLFARERFPPDFDYDIIEKSCMLATRFLESTTAAFIFLHTMFNPYDSNDPNDHSESYRFGVPNDTLEPQPRYQNPYSPPQQADHEKLHCTIAAVAEHITISFEQHGNNRGTTCLNNQKPIIIMLSDLYYPVCGWGSDIHLRPSTLTMPAKIHDLKKRGAPYNTAHDVWLTFSTAETLLHEAVHALHYAIRGLDWESFWRTGSVAELGFEFQNALFGGDYRCDHFGYRFDVYTHTFDSASGRKIEPPVACDVSEYPNAILFLSAWPEISMVGSYRDERRNGGEWDFTLRRRKEFGDREMLMRVPFVWIAQFCTNEFWGGAGPLLRNRTPEKFIYCAGPQLMRRVWWDEKGELGFEVIAVQ